MNWWFVGGLTWLVSRLCCCGVFWLVRLDVWAGVDLFRLGYLGGCGISVGVLWSLGVRSVGWGEGWVLAIFGVFV